jgi:uncharacterized membrane protein
MPAITPLTIAALTGSGLIAGLLFVFSNCVMRSLAEMPAGEGMRAMQLINRKILNPVFLGIFMGTTLVCLALIALAAINRPPGFAFAIAGAACYVVGGFGITAARNVPLNNELDEASIDSDAARALWERYLRDWTRWNHIRVILCTLAMPLLALSL